jgi:hypothetical protein
VWFGSGLIAEKYVVVAAAAQMFNRVEGPDLDIPELLILWPNSIAQRRASVQLIQRKSPVADKQPYDLPWRLK